MGSLVAKPKAYHEQVVALAVPHSLQTNSAKQLEQIELLNKFGPDLYLCYYQSGKAEVGCDYKHYFITDRNWTMEFLKEGVAVHANPQSLNYVTEKQFKMTPEVRKRMEQVCGALGYSLCLRNCEHLARFLQSGSWVSLQMVPQGVLRKYFINHILAEQMAMINKVPEELKSTPHRTCIYPKEEYSGFVKFSQSPSALNKHDEDAYNVLVIGPTGAGKSRIVNLFFNQTVADSAPTAKSVTREMAIYSGSSQMYDLCGQLVERKVNVIDSIGLCDSDLSPEVVISLIKEHLKVNFMNIDRVVVVCSGRIEEPHSSSIKQIMTWLRYEQFAEHFLFLYNKSDLQPEELRAANLGDLCTVLGVRLDEVTLLNDCKLPSECLPENGSMPSPMRHEKNKVALPLAKATGFPEGNFTNVQAELYELLDGVFIQLYKSENNRKASRMGVSESWCPIL